MWPTDHGTLWQKAIEEKIDENVYPLESAIKPERIRQLKKAHADIKKGKGKTYNSIDDFFREIEV